MFDTDDLNLFWEWFTSLENSFYHIEEYQEELLPEALERITRIHPDLVFEIGPVVEGKREFVVSANGVKDAFSAVIELVDAAPKLAKWDFVAFRKRKNPQDIRIQYEDLELTPDDIFFSYEFADGKFELNLYLADFKPKDKPLAHLVMIMLDNVLGEYDVEMKLHTITLHKLNVELSAESLYELRDLPAIVDQCFYRRVD
jgi:hypothetical protein